MTSLRQTLERFAELTTLDPDAFTSLDRRRRRRHRNRRIAAAIVALSVAGAGTWGTLALVNLAGNSKSVAAGPVRTATAQGMTLTFPSDWTLIQSGHAGVDPHILNLSLPVWDVFQLTNYPPPIEPSALCPVSQSLPANGVRLFVQRMIGSGAGSFVGAEWPIPPQLSRVSAGSAFECGPGYHQAWQVGDRRFVAVITFGPEASLADQRALIGAFRSMDFRWIAYQDRWISYVIPGSWDSMTRRLVRTLIYSPKLVLTSVTSGRERFTFTAMKDPANLFKGIGPTLELEAANIGPVEPPEPGESMIARRYNNEGQLRIVLGSVTRQVARVDVVTGGRTFRANLIDFPAELPGEYRGYFVNLDGLDIRGGEILASDANGNVLQRLPLS